MLKNKHLVFIGGFPSGGTDLLKNILNAHSDIYLNGEMPFLYRFPDHISFAYRDYYTKLEAEQILRWLSEHDIWNNLSNIDGAQKLIIESEPDLIKKEFLFYHLFSDKERKVWGNKTPQNTENVHSLIKLFPESKFVIITRDVRDVVLSWLKKWGKNPYLVAEKWSRRMSDISDLATTSDQILMIKFEELLVNTEDITKKVCEYLNIKWDRKMPEYHQYINQKVEGKINYGKPIKKDNKQKWRDQATQSFVTRIEEIAYEGLQKLDYEVVYANKYIPLSNLYRKYGTIHDAFAMIFVGNRAKEDNSIFSRFKEIYKQIKLKTS